MTAQPNKEPAPFNPMAAYQREREHNQRLYDLLTAALFMLEHDTPKLEAVGHDVSHRKAWIDRAKKERFEA